MGKIGLTPEQEFVFEKIAKDKYLSKRFYLTSGTALSAFYLHHRLSEDLDFFSETQFSNNYIIKFMGSISSNLKAKSKFTQIEETRIFELKTKDKILKIDFNYYPFKRIKQGKKLKGVEIDSLFDIATNKLLLLNQRTDIKDFVDSYFLLKKYTVWDLMTGVQKKFKMELDPILVAADMLKIENLEYLPKMLKPLKIENLKDYFRKQAKKIGGKITT